ncbi:keratin, type II cytoskeletal 1 [Hetaerina americana]|uniref:keratin, type II cytoskeletal 1 n=1 Tax=Hetaerina americana TaxID=62018 RepID=UPI003A7F5EDE
MINPQGRLFLALALASALVAATPVANVVSSADPDDLVGGIAGDCLRKSDSLVTCVKGKLFAAVDRALKANEEGFSLVDGVEVVKTDAPVEAETEDGSPRSLEQTPIEDLVWSRFSRFLRTHTVKVDVKGSEVAESISNVGRTLGDVAESLGFGDSVEESGRKKAVKTLKILLPLLLLLKLKIAALIPLAIAAIALIAGKALLIGKLALVLAIVLGLKKLFSQEKVVTYEVVAHPHHSHSHGHSIVSGGHDDSYSVGGGGGGSYSGGGGSYSSSGSGSSGGWGRSFEVQGAAPSGWEPQDLAYRAHQPQPQANSQQ